MLAQIIYVSSAVQLLRPDDLSLLLQQARRNNRRDGITGMLLYHGGTFMQVFEGEAETVSALHDRILGDPRHRGVIELYNGPVPERQFPDWAMGSVAGSAVLEAEPQFHDFAQSDIHEVLAGAAESRARTLLLSFGRQMR